MRWKGPTVPTTPREAYWGRELNPPHAAWNALGMSSGLLLSQSLSTAYSLGWGRALFNAQARPGGAIRVGNGLWALLSQVLNSQLSRMSIRTQEVNRRVRKFSPSSPRFKTQIAFSPERVRLGNLYRLLRLVMVADDSPLRDSRARFSGGGVVGLWALGRLRRGREIQNLQFRSHVGRR